MRTREQPLRRLLLLAGSLPGANKPILVRAIVAARLSRVWSDLREREREKPEWSDPERTSLYGIDPSVSPPDPTGYEAHAGACWALAADWYEALGHGPRPELADLEGAVRVVAQTHWAWLRVPGNRVRFDAAFIAWVEREHLDAWVAESTQGVVDRTGVVARQPIAAGQFIGYVDGDIVASPSEHTLQIGEAMHLRVTSVMRYLNHADAPNALVRGLTVLALEAIAPGQEVTIDYNCTEARFSLGGVAAGYARLSTEERRRRVGRLHRWIREREARGG